MVGKSFSSLEKMERILLILIAKSNGDQQSLAHLQAGLNSVRDVIQDRILGGDPTETLCVPVKKTGTKVFEFS